MPTHCWHCGRELDDDHPAIDVWFHRADIRHYFAACSHLCAHNLFRHMLEDMDE